MFSKKQRISAGGSWEYVWIGEFGEMENYRWNSLNMSGTEYSSSTGIYK
jgi:hypothetical protein